MIKIKIISILMCSVLAGSSLEVGDAINGSKKIVETMKDTGYDMKSRVFYICSNNILYSERHFGGTGFSGTVVYNYKTNAPYHCKIEIKREKSGFGNKDAPYIIITK